MTTLRCSVMGMALADGGIPPRRPDAARAHRRCSRSSTGPDAGFASRRRTPAAATQAPVVVAGEERSVYRRQPTSRQTDMVARSVTTRPCGHRSTKRMRFAVRQCSSRAVAQTADHTGVHRTPRSTRPLTRDLARSIDGSQTRLAGRHMLNLLLWFGQRWGFADRLLRCRLAGWRGDASEQRTTAAAAAEARRCAENCADLFPCLSAFLGASVSAVDF